MYCKNCSSNPPFHVLPGWPEGVSTFIRSLWCINEELGSITPLWFACSLTHFCVSGINEVDIDLWGVAAVPLLQDASVRSFVLFTCG